MLTSVKVVVEVTVKDVYIIDVSRRSLTLVMFIRGSGGIMRELEG